MENKHFDIALFGFWYGGNYGSLLNGYSMYKIFEALGKTVLLVQKPGAKIDDSEINNTHNAIFASKYYNSENICKPLPYDRLKDINHMCDTFCAGSDQIWNYNLSFHKNLYLPFANDDKRLISFATSFGHARDKTPDSEKPEIRKYLSRYSAISVREQFSVDICRNIYGLKAELVFEPVFCVDRGIFSELAANSEFSESEPFLLTYILDPTPEKRAAIQYYGQNSGLKVINILDGVKRVYERNKGLLDLPNVLGDVGSEDLLKAFMDCQYVITDSFHGSAFAIIFNKPFLSIANPGRGLARFYDLLGRLKLMDRLAPNPKEILHDKKFLAPPSFSETNGIIEAERKKTIEWLKNALETPVENKVERIFSPVANNVMCAENVCCGCGACWNICPTGAIKAKRDINGYNCADINLSKCINCGKCDRICPVATDFKRENNKDCECYEFIVNHEEMLLNSSSGGVFGVVAEELLNNGGCVAGVAFDDEFKSVSHILVNNIVDLHRIQKSKYMQSDVDYVYREIKKRLESGQHVLFSGCPCQVVALYKVVGEHDNLVSMDLLCGHSPSPMFFQKYIDESFGGRKLEFYQFRHKKTPENSWIHDCVTVTVTGEEMQIRNTANDAYQ